MDFCGYTIPHPSDAKMHLRIQTSGKRTDWDQQKDIEESPRLTRLLDSTTALEALEKGFNDLMDLCDVVTEKFTASRDQFNEENSNKMQS